MTARERMQDRRWARMAAVDTHRKAGASTRVVMRETTTTTTWTAQKAAAVRTSTTTLDRTDTRRIAKKTDCRRGFVLLVALVYVMVLLNILINARLLIKYRSRSASRGSICSRRLDRRRMYVTCVALLFP